MNSRSAEVLTPREQEVIELLSAGLTNEEIARQLGISLDGVKYHVSGIFRRLRVKNRHQAASLHLGIDGGVLTPREQEVIELLSAGLTNEEIARQLGISLAGVKHHVSGILRRLKVESRREAASLHLRTARSGRLAALAPVMFLRKLPFGWLGKAAAGAALTTTAAGIALLAWGLISTSNNAVTTTGCRAEQSAGGAPNCAPGVAQAAAGADAITAISGGPGYTCAVKDGGVLCWGSGFAGQDQPGRFQPAASSSIPVPVQALTSGVSAISPNCAVKDGGAWCWGGPLVPGVLPGLESGVSAITTSSYGPHACAVKDGGAWCWGYNVYDQFDNTADPGPAAVVSGLTSGVSAIGAGGPQTCALKDGGAWCWGGNANGQLGNNSTTDSDVVVAVSGMASGVSAISAGDAHVCALKGGGVWCWGANGHGQLGNNSTTDSPVPVAVSGLAAGVSAISAAGADTCALTNTGGVWCWGVNGRGQLGDNSTTDSSVPVAVSGLASGATSVSTGGDHACALTDGRALCWGDNTSGQLGNNRPPSSDVPVAVSGLASGVSAIEGTCALKGGGVWCWGSNVVGQLGNNSTTDSSVPVAVVGLASGVTAISPGPCALKDGRLWCWGLNDAAGLGNNHTTESHVPVAVTGPVGGVGATGERPTWFEGFGVINKDWLVGRCALKDGGVLCWGGGLIGTTESLGSVPGLESGVSAISGTCALKDGGVLCWEIPNSGNRIAQPVAVPGLESGVSAISGNCALKDGGAWCGVGFPKTGEPLPGLESGVSAISGGFGFGDDCALKDGGVWCWHADSYVSYTAPVALPGLESGVSAISGECAVKEGGVWCWGDNSNGQLGNNSPLPYSVVPVAVQFTPPGAGVIAAAPPTDVAVQLPPPSAGDISPTPDVKPRAEQSSTDSADHRTAYVLGGSAAVALAIVVAGVWAVRRRRRIS